MVSALRMLIMDDSAADAELLTIAIQRAGFTVECERVQDAARLSAAVRRQEWDVVVCAFRSRALSGEDAIRIVRRIALAPLVLGLSDWESDAALSYEAGASAFAMKNNFAAVPAMIALHLATVTMIS